MKKLAYLLMAMVLVFTGLVGCGNEAQEQPKKEPEQAQDIVIDDEYDVYTEEEEKAFEEYAKEEAEAYENGELGIIEHEIIASEKIDAYIAEIDFKYDNDCLGKDILDLFYVETQEFEDGGNAHFYGVVNKMNGEIKDELALCLVEYDGEITEINFFMYNNSYQYDGFMIKACNVIYDLDVETSDFIAEMKFDGEDGTSVIEKDGFTIASIHHSENGLIVYTVSD